MTTRVRRIARSKGVRQFALMVVLNLTISVTLVTIGASRDFVDIYKTCNAIGFSTWGAFEALRFFLGERVPALLLSVFAVPAGFVLGAKVSGWVGATDLFSLIARDPTGSWRLLVGSLMIAMFATTFFIFYWRSEAVRADLQSERRRAAEALQSETSAKLALLQAQIEPHFLFNTLANAQSVIQSDPQTAKRILENLNQYLRVSLGRTRRVSSTLADELNVVSAVLTISAMRLGDRLRYSISVPRPLEAAQLPPLLLQPLVENALQHGIEPALNGGEIRIEASRDGDSLCLRVTDTGVGLSASSPEGVGLGNVRGRLNSLYRERGRLTLYEHEPHGVVAEITIPLRGA